MATIDGSTDRSMTSWWQPVVFAALAGGLGWGIRGQYGHETGAMIAGVLVSLTLIFLLCRGLRTLQAVRAAALGAVAMGIGGSMTYGVTLGLTQNPELIGNWSALRWGLLGCAIKGGLWIGFAGLFLGMGLGGKHYRVVETLALMVGLVLLCALGVAVLNRPFDIEARQFSALHFSNVWYWAPESTSKPRPEVWGGLLFAYLAGLVYAGAWKKDTLARNLALWGLLGGAIGFPGGQCLQAFHAWNPDVFQRGIWVSLDPHMNWWNTMETTFGCIMGGALGLGLWLNRDKIAPEPELETGAPAPGVEWALLGLHAALLVYIQLYAGIVEALYDNGLTLALIPIVLSIRGRIWPWFVVLPVTVIPIGMKTVRELALNNDMLPASIAWPLYAILPVLLTGAIAWRASRRADGAADFVPMALLVNVWLYFLLNYAYFRFPFPWSDWTGRTPSGIVFTVFAVALTAMVWGYRDRAADGARA